ncbi:pre-peptidase C-terminal domain-containing protein [Heyndrickxia vini]|uniref:Pre-peptidase C-terminal domain-containing protein n=1 Tax=Heyndrickxia vini TaxID=1476025 RepID=A0ABX7E3Y7_9BACI|nr:pre-peptidase C-terminal domain-containing protein [Heyndrickxia vini]QQZ10018.1 pre-peptidase C-terminal domain-containing protein [Heyndrickxia vini]
MNKRCRQLIAVVFSFIMLLGIVPSLAMKASADTGNQESEPNDTLEYANELMNGTYKYGKISSDTDVDWYGINVLEEGDIRATLEELPLDYELQLYDQNGNEITSSTRSGTNSEVINFIAREPGKYFLKVVGSYGDYSTTRSYKIKVTYPSEQPQFNAAFEPNDTKENAYPIRSGTPYRAKIETSVDRDFYKIQAKTEGQIRVTLENLPFDYELYLYDAAGEEVSSSRHGGTDPEVINFYTRESGTFYVAVIPSGENYSTSSSYTLKAFFPSNVQFGAAMEPNDIKEQAFPVASGKKYSAKIETMTDVDYYKITAEKEGTIYARLERLPYDYEIQLLDRNGDEVAYSTRGSSTSEKISYYVREPGVYYLLVYPYNGAYSSTFSYNLQVTYPTKKVTHASNFEPNDTLESAYIVKSRTNYAQLIDSPVDIDWYAFKGTAGKKARISLTSLPFDYELYLYDRYGTEISSSTSGGTTSEYIDFAISKTAYYYVLVRPSGENYSTSKKYNLKVVYGPVPAPKVNKITTKTTKVTGTAASGLRVYVKKGSKVLGTSTVAKGKYAVKIPKQKKKTVLTIVARDEAGNYSSAVKTTVK